MGDHVHYDVAEAERIMRAGIRQTNQEAFRRADGDLDRELVKLQGNLEDMTVAAAVWGMRCVNEMATEEVAAEALGYVIGNIIWSFAINSSEPPVDAFNRVLRSVWIAAEAAAHGEYDGYVDGQTTVSAAKSGRA
ncbi:hypothetical protein NKH61_05375 [Mesorhizobium sp. M1005]|uniref:hypothetical protein n=1 Tax=unclassified Mesorhizobium TaxID=325217 RepID=UPI00333C96CE